MQVDGNTDLELAAWLAAELGRIEAALAGQGSSCQLDRCGASTASQKSTEGRYFIVRRALRLLERGESLTALQAEADKARAFLSAPGGVGRDARWAAYFEGVLGAVDAVLQRQPAPVAAPGAAPRASVADG